MPGNSRTGGHSRIAEALFRAYLRARLRGRAFSIVTNNCWGADVYPAAGSPYQTPFVGLFIRPECYLRLLGDPAGLGRRALRFTGSSRYDDVNRLRGGMSAPYPIGVLGGDVEILFMHYRTEAEAREKWTRRLSRMSGGTCFVKFCDTDGPSPAQMEAFDGLPLTHKVCFVGAPRPTVHCACHLPGFERTGRVHNVQLTRHYRRSFDVADWLRGGSGTPRGLYRLLVRTIL